MSAATCRCSCSQFHQQNSNVLITFYRCSTDVLAAGLLHQEYDIIFTWDSDQPAAHRRASTFHDRSKRPSWWWRSTLDIRFAQRRQLAAARAARGEHLIYVALGRRHDSYGDAFFMQLLQVRRGL